MATPSTSFDTFSIPSLQFFNYVIFPAFADLQPEGFPFRGTLNEFTLMDDVSSSRQIIDIRRTQNILTRRDGSCDLVYKKLAGTTVRKVSTEEVYAAVQICKNEFYKGCLKDWRNSDPLFGRKILPWFQSAVNVDIASNAYFGDVDRVPVANAQWSHEVFDGIFKWYKRYITAGVIPSSQTIAIADGTDYNTTPADAYALIKTMYSKQNLLMYSFDDMQKAFYVSKEIARGYEDYLISVGLNADGISLILNGVRRLTYKGIPIIEEPIWTPIITELKGSAGYAAIFTLRGNFIFATDKNYGEGEDGKTALMVWYEKKDLMWYYQMFLKAGTQVALPEHSVIALSSWT